MCVVPGECIVLLRSLAILADFDCLSRDGHYEFFIDRNLRLARIKGANLLVAADWLRSDDWRSYVSRVDSSFLSYMQTFLELQTSAVTGTILLLDIDGTLTHDHGTEIDLPIQQKIHELSQVAEIYLCSNGPLERTRVFANLLGVNWIESTHHKPNRRMIERLHRGDKKVIVVGDKILTDGIFAKNCGATFIPIKHLRHIDDSLLTRLIYLFDDSVGILTMAVFPLWPYLALLRPLQWIKNSIILGPAFFAGTLFRPETAWRTLLTILVFCTVASMAYVFNDLCDIKQDHLHPTKRFRPFPSGAVSPQAGKGILVVLLMLLGIELWILPALIPIIATYVVLNILYSTSLKHTAVLDIAVVASFYVLRIVAGGVGSATYISPWIILCAFFGALFIVIGKRRAESMQVEKRKVLQAYSQATLDAMLLVATALMLASYGLYSILGNRSSLAVYSTIFVVIAVFRLLNRMYLAQEVAEYPEHLLFHDHWVLAMIVLWIGYLSILLY